MEIIFALCILTFLLLITLGGAVWFWVGLFFLAVALGFRAYRTRCKQCGKSPITGRGMRFCNQCAAEQPPGFFRIRCASCRGLARSELGLQFCNHCGASVT